MRKILLIVLLLSFFVVDAQESKTKLAVMEFEDISETLDTKMLSNAAEYLRSEFVSSNQFVIIAKERQEKALKEMKKESYQMCRDKSCQIPLGQKLSADTVLRTTINYFGGIYTITSEMIDLAKEATVKGAKFQFDGSEQGLMKAMERIVVQLAGKSISFKPGILKADEVEALKMIGGTKLSELPTVEVEEGNFDEINVTSTLGKVSVDSSLALEADADVMVAYDQALTADENGEQNPKEAMDKWYALWNMEGKNPFKERANARYLEWEKHIETKDMADKYEKAKRLDKYGQLFPDYAIKAWQIVEELGESPYFSIAKERIAVWEKFKEQIEGFKIHQEKFDEQRLVDQKNLIKVLPLKFLNEEQKRVMMVKYLEIYAPFYGIDDLDLVFGSIEPEKSKKLISLLYNEYLKEEMKEKCERVPSQESACFISASLTELENPQESLVFFEKACSGGVPDACVKAGKFYYGKSDLKSSEYFSTACSWGSPEGCHIMGFFSEIGFGVSKNNSVAKKLYKKACDNGYEVSCKMYKNIVNYGFSSDQVKKILKSNDINLKISDTVGKEGDDFAREVKPKVAFNDTSMSVKVKERGHVYWKGGVSMIVIGAALVVGGVTGFELAAKNKYDEYNSRTTDEKIFEAIKTGVSEAEYIKSVNEYKDRGNLYRTLSIVSGATGGALIIGGIIAASVKAEKEVLKKVSFLTDGRSFYAALSLDF
jgi:hypothetical protein